MQQSCPGAVAAFYMAYLQEDASLPAAGEQEPSRPSAATLPSTRASTKPSAGTLDVPQITFLYRCCLAMCCNMCSDAACGVR